MLQNYGTITLEHVIASKRIYNTEQQRKAQDTYMIYRQCLMASLTSEAMKKVMIWTDQHEQIKAEGACQVQQWGCSVEGRDSQASLGYKRNNQPNQNQAVNTGYLHCDDCQQQIWQVQPVRQAHDSVRTCRSIFSSKDMTRAVSNETFRAWCWLTRKQSKHGIEY